MDINMERLTILLTMGGLVVLLAGVCLPGWLWVWSSWALNRFHGASRVMMPLPRTNVSQ